MALFQTCPFPSTLLQSHTHLLIPKPLISKTLIPTTKIPNFSSIQIPVSPNKPYPYYLQTVCCTTSTSSSMLSNESSSPSSSSIFVKGLPQSTTEGRLKKAFSQFGEVNQVKIITDEKNKQSLGYAFVWFTRAEYAQLAVEEMNGKFFDGRFILVKIGKPRLSKDRGRATPYKF